jgi:hypothetical protein
VRSTSTPTSAPSPKQIELRCVRTAGVGSAGKSTARVSANSDGVAFVASASVPVALVASRVACRVASVASASSSVASASSSVASASVPVACLLRSVASVASRSPVELRKSRPRFSSVALLADLSSVPPVLTPFNVALRQVASLQNKSSPVALYGGKLRSSQLRQSSAPPQLRPSRELRSSHELRLSPELRASASELFVLRHPSVASASPSHCPRIVLGRVIELMAVARQEDVSKRISRRFAQPSIEAVRVEVPVASASVGVEQSRSSAQPNGFLRNSGVASNRIHQTFAGRKHLN